MGRAALLKTLSIIVLAVIVASPVARAGGVLDTAFEGFEAVPLAAAARHGKWWGVVERHRADLAENASGIRPARAQAWNRLLASIRAKPPRLRVAAVHRAFADFRYASDRMVWGVEDYWATPFELFAAGMGDCEDFAIAKYFILRELGLPIHALRLAVVSDLHQGGKAHAILLVKSDGHLWVLDNLRREVGDAATLARYRPIFDLDENAFRIYRARPGEISGS